MLQQLESARREVVEPERICDLLGRPGRPPLTSREMAASLSLRFFDGGRCTPRVTAFTEELRRSLVEAGVTIAGPVPVDASGRSRRRNGVRPRRDVMIAPGELETGNLPIDHVDSLRTTTVMGVHDGPFAGFDEPDPQKRLDLLIRTLIWDIVPLAIFVEDDHWTLGTANGALARFPRDEHFGRRIREILVPKLAAPVVPPRSADFDHGDSAVPTSQLANGDTSIIEKFRAGARAWGESGLMLYHTPLSTLPFRNRRYAHIARAYLDRRSGMSYGFMSQQLPTPIPQARLLVDRETAGEDLEVSIAGMRYAIPVPAIRLLATRSGCDKSNVDVERDLTLLEMEHGRIKLTAVGVEGQELERKPSYDILTILAHGLGNVVAASILRCERIASDFPDRLESEGVGLAHWHSEIAEDRIPDELPVHGTDRPPVSCSTIQSALYSVLGKVAVLEGRVEAGQAFDGDVHVEPLHGVNVSGRSLSALADLAAKIHVPEARG